MTAIASLIAHLVALAREWLGDRRQASAEAAIRQAQADAEAVQTLRETRSAEHAALDEMADPADRSDAARRLRDGRF
jgi:hypothetical protein